MLAYNKYCNKDVEEKFVDGNKVTLDLRKYFQNYCGFIQKTTQLIEISIQEIYYIKSVSVPVISSSVFRSPQ
ncbi:unnamed protein product [Rhizophagus irregularis]|nr:unnamed protein product [Rhizophagus irregularis]